MLGYARIGVSHQIGGIARANPTYAIGASGNAGLVRGGSSGTTVGNLV
jgi:hypothetical protein